MDFFREFLRTIRIIDRYQNYNPPVFQPPIPQLLPDFGCPVARGPAHFSRWRPHPDEHLHIRSHMPDPLPEDDDDHFPQPRHQQLSWRPRLEESPYGAHIMDLRHDRHVSGLKTPEPGGPEVGWLHGVPRRVWYPNIDHAEDVAKTRESFWDKIEWGDDEDEGDEAEEGGEEEEETDDDGVGFPTPDFMPHDEDDYMKDLIEEEEYDIEQLPRMRRDHYTGYFMERAPPAEDFTFSYENYSGHRRHDMKFDLPTAAEEHSDDDDSEDDEKLKKSCRVFPVKGWWGFCMYIYKLKTFWESLPKWHRIQVGAMLLKCFQLVFAVILTFCLGIYCSTEGSKVMEEGSNSTNATNATAKCHYVTGKYKEAVSTSFYVYFILRFPYWKNVNKIFWFDIFRKFRCGIFEKLFYIFYFIQTICIAHVSAFSYVYFNETKMKPDFICFFVINFLCVFYYVFRWRILYEKELDNLTYQHYQELTLSRTNFECPQTHEKFLHICSRPYQFAPGYARVPQHDIFERNAKDNNWYLKSQIINAIPFLLYSMLLIVRPLSIYWCEFRLKVGIVFFYLVVTPMCHFLSMNRMDIFLGNHDQVTYRPTDMFLLALYL